MSELHENKELFRQVILATAQAFQQITMVLQ